MYIQKLNGGLGNQAFQYIFSRYFEEATGNKVVLDDSHYFIFEDKIRQNKAGMVAPIDKTTHNGYEMEYVFPYIPKPTLLSELLDADVWEYMIGMARKGTFLPQLLLESIPDLTMLVEASGPEFEGFTGKRLHTPANLYNSCVTGASGNVYFQGYWINHGWFNAYRELFLREMRFRPITDARNRQYVQDIIGCYSVGLHVRRGDFIRLGWAAPTSYYQQIVALISKQIPRAVYFVFSDEIEWCKENAKELGLNGKEAVFVEGNYDHMNNYIDMQLMTMVRYLVVGPSSFPYLACLLNQRPGFDAHHVRRHVPEDQRTLLTRAAPL